MSFGSICPVRMCHALCVMTKRLFYLWQVMLLSCSSNLRKSPPHVRMSMVMSRHLLCLWKEWCVCLIGMLRAICFLGMLKLASVRFSFRDYPWKECPPFSLLFSNSLTLSLLSSSFLPSARTHGVTLAQMWGREASSPLIHAALVWSQSTKLC